MNAIVVTRAINDVLYSRMVQTLKLPFPRVQARNFFGVRGSIEYLFHCFSYHEKYDWILNIDEDCLIKNNHEILDLIDHMEKNNYDFCGMPDGGRCVHRFHNPIAMNPFFNVFSKKFCRSLSLADKRLVAAAKMQDSLMPFSPQPLKGKFQYDNYEPFYPIFFWAILNGNRPLYLESEELKDQTTTVLKFKNDFLVHTWYSRSYGKDPVQTRRIDAVFNEFSSNP